MADILPEISILAPPKITRKLMTSPSSLFAAAISLRVVLLLYGSWHDANSALKYTDIDYYVFTDAARYISRCYSPYRRDTYRYTPLLAWLLLPTTWTGSPAWWSFGKALFAASDVLAGYLIFLLLKRRGLTEARALQFSAIWLLNPMVATISTRGSSEGLLCAMVIGLLFAVEVGHVALAGALLGSAVHFKIYPFIYGASIFWALESPPLSTRRSKADMTKTEAPSWGEQISHFLNLRRLTLLLTSLAIFSMLNILFIALYGTSFVEHSYLYHLTRTDHRHNFSPYATALHLASAAPPTTLSFSSLAFLPQLLLSALLVPLCLAKADLASCMLAQTLAFVAFNKVCTAQYFTWYLVFLPLYLPDSVLMRKPMLGLGVLCAWVAGQAVWLRQAYLLEFLGVSTFVPGLWGAGLLFFGVNCWVLGVVVSDVLDRNESGRGLSGKAVKPQVVEMKAPGRTHKLEELPDSQDEDGPSDLGEDDSDVEEVVRQGGSVQDMVAEQMRRRRVKEGRRGRSGNPHDVLSSYINDIQGLQRDDSD